jgi:hypothetical protein
MNINFSSIAKAGVLDEERVILSATGKADLGQYAIFKCHTANDDDTDVYSGDVPHAYWFMAADVSKGDYIVVYSKRGTRSEKKNPDGTTSHFFYWGLSKPIWTPGFTPVVVNTGAWLIGTPIKKAGTT